MWFLPATHRLPLAFDAERLQASWRALADRPRSPIRSETAELWSGISLLGRTSDPLDATFQEPIEEGRPTPALERVPYLAEVLDAFPQSHKRARILCLSPGGRVYEHYDRNWSLDRGVARLHIPIQTHERVRFYLGHRRLRWKPGEVWYADFCFAHHVTNASPTDRVHLVIDLYLDEHLRGLLAPEHLRPSLLREAARQMNYRTCDARNAVKRVAKRALVRTGVWAG